ncbi:MAG TPA: 16S rRNA (guanine(966)-N(2))-methyltransferase RsmD [Thermoanaerobaculia bacterium]|nr:16S rRNA (guanine(966)-N(2))-methyltransferase RsmD [Thermoanaerobaculia bacterium]
MKPGVRVTGGAHRGRGLTVPPGARPTEGRVREALFSMWGDRLEGARVLDLFAGSGVVGLEAVGRGALSALLIDEDLRAIQTLEENLARVGEKTVKIRRLTLPGGLGRLIEAGPFDLVYADPPYNFQAYETLIAGVAPLLATDGELVVEHASRRDMPVQAGGMVRTDTRKYGEGSLSFYRKGAG